MHSKTLTAILLLGALAALPVHGAQPFGFFEGPLGPGSSGSGVIAVTGWALDDDGVRAVDLFVDGMIVTRADYGRNRPGVTRRFPGFPDSDAAGFAVHFDSTRFLNGLHRIEVRVTSESGERVFLNPVHADFVNTTHLLAPFGEIEFPRPAAELYGTCDLADSPRRLTALTGWALDAGIEPGDMGVGYVELLIDGAIFANSRIDCFFSDARVNRGLTNCYGLRRLDIERTYPTLTNAPQAGFRFVMDIGSLIDFGFAEGQHVLTVRVGDVSGQVSNIDEIPVTFLCDNRIGNEETLGWIAPVGQPQIDDGVVEVRGWALDWEGVERVLVLLDGREVGEAERGFATPAIARQYPGYPDNNRAGWRLQFDSTAFSDGRHAVQAIVVDEEGRTTLLGERELVLDNFED